MSDGTYFSEHGKLKLMCVTDIIISNAGYYNYCFCLKTYVLYMQNNWRVKYLANRSKIVVGVTLI